MKKDGFLNISIGGETSQIGVVKYTKDKKINLYEIESKIVEALKEHYQCPVKIIMVETKKLNPLFVNAEVIIEHEEGDRQTTVFLEETWVY